MKWSHNRVRVDNCLLERQSGIAYGIGRVIDGINKWLWLFYTLSTTCHPLISFPFTWISPLEIENTESRKWKQTSFGPLYYQVTSNFLIYTIIVLRIITKENSIFHRHCVVCSVWLWYVRAEKVLLFGACHWSMARIPVSARINFFSFLFLFRFFFIVIFICFRGKIQKQQSNCVGKIRCSAFVCLIVW